MKIPSSGEMFFFLEDLREILRKKGKRIAAASLMGASLFFSGFTWLQDPVYQVEATYRDQQEKGKGKLSPLESFGRKNGEGFHLAPLFTSRQILRPVVERLGLQMQMRKEPLVPRLKRRTIEAFRAEIFRPLPDLAAFEFRNVSYEQEKKTRLFLCFEDRKRFSVLDENRHPLAYGVVGEEVSLPRLTFTLQTALESLQTGRLYEIEVKPWLTVVNGLAEDVQVNCNKSNRQLYELKMKSRNRHLAARILNEIMREYQASLEREHLAQTQTQIESLKRRKEGLIASFDALVTQHGQRVERVFGVRGFVPFEEEMQTLQRTVDLKERADAIDLKLAELESWDESRASLALLSPIATKIQELREESHNLDLALAEEAPPAQFDLEGLEKLRGERQSVQDHLAMLEKGAMSPPLAQEWDGLERLDRTDQIEFLKSYDHLLSVREQLMEERLKGQSVMPLEGIDLDQIRVRIEETRRQRDEIDQKLKRYEWAQGELQHLDFEFSCLLPLLGSSDLVLNSIEISRKRQDISHYSERERARFEEMLALNRKLLGAELLQMRKSEEISRQIASSTLLGMERGLLSAVNRQIALLQERAASILQGEKGALVRERGGLENKIEDLRLASLQLPQKWNFDQQFKFHLMTIQKSIQFLLQEMEQTEVEADLYHLHTGPYDLAVPPLLPHPPRMIWGTLLGAFLGAVLSFLGFFAVAMRRGFSLTVQKLQELRYPYGGAVGSDQMLQRVSLFCDGAQVVGLFLGQGPSYAQVLADKWGKSQYRTLLLLSEGGDGKIESLGSFDRVAFGIDKIISILEREKHRYDRILIAIRAPLQSIEADILLRKLDRAVVTIQNEPIEELTPFLVWGYHDGGSRVIVITT